MAFETIPFLVAVGLLILGLLILRFVIKTAFTVLKIALLVAFGFGVYFLFTTFL